MDQADKPPRRAPGIVKLYLEGSRDVMVTAYRMEIKKLKNRVRELEDENLEFRKSVAALNKYLEEVEK